MGDPKKQPVTKEEKLAAATIAVDELFKKLKFKSSAEKQKMAAELASRLERIYEDDAKRANLSEGDLSARVSKLVKTFVRDNIGESGLDRAAREALEKELEAANTESVKQVVSARAAIESGIKTAFDGAQKDNPDFKGMRDSRNLMVLDELKIIIPAELNKEGATEESLKEAIAGSLQRGTAGALIESGDVNDSAAAMAKAVWEANKNMKDKVSPILDKFKVKNRKENDGNLTEDEKKSILFEINNNIWPEITRQQVTYADQSRMLKSALEDAIITNADLATKDQASVREGINSAVRALDGYTSLGGQPRAEENRKFITDTVMNAAGGGGSLFGNVKISTGTGIGAGAGAMLGLAVVDTKSTMGILKGIGALALGAGIGAAYDNGAFDNLLKPSGTPKANNGPGGNTVT